MLAAVQQHGLALRHASEELDVPENLRQLAAAQPSQELASQELASQELASHLQVLAAMMSPQAWYHISIFVLVIFL
jgi:hypothetical protein